eukprot:SAG11_NODE_4164_length_2030_cov_1.063698_1_plen_22_part_10
MKSLSSKLFYFPIEGEHGTAHT